MSDMAPEQTPIEAGVPPPAVEESRPSIRLVEKHPLAIRWMHWVNFPLLFIMIWSGLLIYWADSIPPGTHASEVYRVGVGSWTLFRLSRPGSGNLSMRPTGLLRVSLDALPELALSQACLPRNAFRFHHH